MVLLDGAVLFDAIVAMHSFVAVRLNHWPPSLLWSVFEAQEMDYFAIGHGLSTIHDDNLVEQTSARMAAKVPRVFWFCFFSTCSKGKGWFE